MFEHNLNRVNERLNRTFTRNQLLQQTTDQTRWHLQVSRVVVYYFYHEWKGQVIIESLSHSDFSILGLTGPDNCFSGEYADQYLQGKVLEAADIERTGFDLCHLEFFRSIRVRAGFVAPIVVDNQLWGC